MASTNLALGTQKRKASDDLEERTRESPATLRASISPPPYRIKQGEGNAMNGDDVPIPDVTPSAREAEKAAQGVPSPIQLMHVQGLPSSCNVDTVKLKDILGDPLIKECWAFNYLFDVDFLMSCFDEDVRDLVDVTLVHGSWKREDRNRAGIETAVARYKRVKTVTAYMPEAFGTHHSKMLILTRHDELAQVIIFTANFIPRDMTMCQAVWRSPLLPLTGVQCDLSSRPKEVGARFKFDLLFYLKAYGTRLRDLITKIDDYNFSEVRAALIASVPCRQNFRTTDTDHETLWGWPAVKSILSEVESENEDSHIVTQVSSVATLGVHDGWLRQTLFKALSSKAKTSTSQSTKQPSFSIVFPTADEIRRSIDGYACGASIHMKTDSAQQIKQLKYLKPMLCHWAGDHDRDASSDTTIRQAGRRRTGPHIKTYLRFSDAAFTKLDWAMMTSANLSKQAWGAEATSDGEVRISSYEIGVVVWPALWKEDGKRTEMAPVFKKDMPSVGADASGEDAENSLRAVGMRMPYDLPLVPYSETEKPWSNAKPDLQLDSLGRGWKGY